MIHLKVSADGWLQCGNRVFRCTLGRGGVTTDKREGDGATPAGTYPLRQLLYRSDRLAPPTNALPTSTLRPRDGWCDDPGHSAYNRPVTLPLDASAESMWRDDHLYDLVVVLGYNDDPVVSGLGSAIFLHVASPEYSPTEGCIALAKEDLLTVLADITPGSDIRIENP